jgi:glycosyltransferase involved in cell wall biosynthesis
MNRQFVLIDNSIEDFGGHYLEYARRVLGAAKAEGFHTILAVNQRAHKIRCEEADLLLKPFSKTFWENQSVSKLWTALGFVSKRVRLSICADYAAAFADELALLASQANLKNGDIVFAPTIGGSELVGISQYSVKKSAVSISWHLLFRRDISSTADWFDFRSRIDQWRTISSFAIANATFGRGVRFFYTDTQELSHRYEGLGVGKFTTLPIPIDEQLGYKKPWTRGPLVVSYLGDMRAEKGIHFLPNFIESLRKDGFDDSQVVFRIQGNLPKGPYSRSAARTKKALTDNDAGGVEVINGPLDSATYRELLLTSDIVLLPYSTVSYAARSSGVFVEAIAAGIPTIYPQDSWMGRQLTSLYKKGYSNINEIVSNLKAILRDYARCEASSRELCKNWRVTHSAKGLVQIIVNK